jgi:hypothetical protein
MQYYRRKPLSPVATDPLDEADRNDLPQDRAVKDPAALVKDAAAILEQEMAAGVLAARDARKAGFEASTPAQAVGPSPGDLLGLVGQYQDWLPGLQESIGQWLESVVRQPKQSETGVEQAPVLRAGNPVESGADASIAFKLHNDHTQPARLGLRCTDLTAESGQRIPARQLVFRPAEVELGPDEYTDIVLRIGIPQGTPPGTYSGLLTASGLPYLKAVVTLEVA